MDDRRFDNLTRTAFTESSRRQVLVGAASGLLALVPLPSSEHAAAKKKGKSKKKKKKKTFRFQANPMTGAQEVAPTVGDPNGSGSAQFQVKGNQICGTFTFATTTPFTVTGTHIHEGAAGVSGGIVVDFGAATLGVETCLNCTTSACEPGVLGRIKANPAGFYANIHTNAFTNGAVRGQLQRV